ncbi:17936_t:CDS:10, partial [Funneliformis geosporum]
MNSQIYYKFKSAKDYDNITFDGLGISVFDAKKEILTAKKLKGNDFDIVVTHAESGEDYQEDTAIIPRNTPIVVRRVPTKQGKGTAHRYLEGVPAPRNAATGNRVNYGNANGSMSKTFDSSKQQQQMQISRPSPIPTITHSSGEEQTEEDKIAAMFAQSSEFWEKTQEQMASKPALRRPNQPRPQVKQQILKALPPNYVCYRCGQKGHWIQACPTNGDRSFDHMKVRKTTGIPRSFLQKVEQVPPGGKGVLVTQDGNLVIAQANEAAWQKFHARQKSYVTTNEVLEETLPVPPELQCMICARLLREAVITPCCQASFCDECTYRYCCLQRQQILDFCYEFYRLISQIENITECGIDDPRQIGGLSQCLDCNEKIDSYIIDIITEQEDQQFKCPNCQSQLSPDGLLPDKATREAVNNHLRDWARRRNEQIVPEGNSEEEVDNNNNNDLNMNNVVVEEDTIEVSTLAETLVVEKDQTPPTTDLIDHEPPPKVKVEPVVTKVELPKKPIHELPQIPPPQQSILSQQSQLPQQRTDNLDITMISDLVMIKDTAGYPQMNMNMMNAPGGYYDPSYFESGFYPADHFPAQFIPPFRPPVYDEFWDNRPMIPPQGNFTPFGNNVGGGMGGGAIQPFRGGFRGAFAQRGGNFQTRGRGGGGGRGRSTNYFYEQRPFNSGHGSSSNNEFRRESSMSPSVGRREASERPEYREGEQKYEDERLVDDFGRDLARRKSLTSHNSPDKDSRDKLTPPLLPDRDRRDRDMITDEDLDNDRRYVDERRVSDDRRYYDDRRYSISDRRDERRESISDRRSDRDRDNRRDDRRDSYNSSRYDGRRESIGDRKDSRRISIDERKDDIRNQGLPNERYNDQEKARTPSPNNMMNDENDNVSSTKDDRPTTPPSPDKFLDKRRHSSSHKHRSSKYHRSSHHRHESLDKEDTERNSTSKLRHTPYPKDDYHRSGNRKHKKHHTSRHHSNRHRNSRSKEGESIRRRNYSRDRDE